jgi:tRNA(Ile)-lysidine synthase
MTTPRIMTKPRIVLPQSAPPGAEPLRAAEFAGLMAPAGPFEPAPHLAVALSGGPDSLALALLADGWSRRRGGSVTALTVEHGLRPESAAEARQVGRWLAARGIAHRILPWRGTKPASGVQAAARAARLDLLAAWCARHHVLHLLTGHQMEDQAATLLLRLSAGSGGDGLAAMPLVQDVATPGGEGVRLVRPLLSVPEERLKAVLRRRAQPWIADPSNLNSGYARTRLAAALDELGGEGLSTRRLARAARRAGSDRAAFDRAAGELLARAACFHPAGFAGLDWALWREAPEALALRALMRLLAAVGGRPFGPRLERVERLAAALRERYPTCATTLGGCRILPRQGALLICREPGAAEPAVVLAPGETRLWDNRFRVRLARTAEVRGETTLGKLGTEGVAQLRRAMADGGGALERIPAAARPALPAFRDLDGLLAVPHVNYARFPGKTGYRACYIGAGNRVGGVFGPSV